MKPANLIYGLEDKPPLWASLVLGLQHICIISIAFIFPVVVVRNSGGTMAQATFLVSMSMIAGGIGAIVQALRKGPLGSGYLCPQVCGPSFLSASMIAAKLGGIPLMLGMTMLAGAVEAGLSRLMHRLRKLFPTEVTGLIVAMVGITVVKLGTTNFLGLSPGDNTIEWQEIMVSVVTLGTMVGLNVWSKGQFKLFCVIIGMAVGYGVAFLVGELDAARLADLAHRPWAALVVLDHPGWSFDWSLVLPFAIATVCSTLKTVGDLTTCQKINDTKWKRPDMGNISGGILADSAGCFSAGLLGGFGQSSSSSNVGLSVATGATSRVIAFATGGLLIVLSFFPKIAGVFAIMPKTVMGATLIFALSFMVVAGFQIVMSRMLDGRKTFVVGLSLIFGLSTDMLPEVYQRLPDWLSPVFASSLSASAVIAVVLNLIMRIGIADRADLKLAAGDPVGEKVFEFMDTWGGRWGARPEVIRRATASAVECLEAVVPQHGEDRPVSFWVRFDEYNLDLGIRHSGPVLDLPAQRPEPEELLTEGGALRLAGHLARSLADKASSGSDQQGSFIRLHFEH